MPVRDQRDVVQLPRPGDFLEEAVRVIHVALDLEPLRLVQAPFGNRQVAHFLVRQVGAGDIGQVLVRPARQHEQLFEVRGREHGRLVRL